MRHTCVRHRCATSRARNKAKSAGCSVYSNLHNGAANHRGIRTDTTDEASRPVRLCKEAADACREGFVGDGIVVEVDHASGIAEVNVLGASGQAFSCAVTHGGVEATGCIASERHSTDSCVFAAVGVAKQ